MIIACPACSTRYVVPDTAISAEGRTVRCAKCRHSWHQEGQELDLANMPEASAVQPPQEKPARPATVQTDDTRPKVDQQNARPGFSDTHRHQEPRLEPAASRNDASPPPPAPAPPSVVETRPAEPYSDPYEEEVSQFERNPPFRPRRNPLKVWTAIGAAFTVITLGTIAAVSYYGVPDILPFQQHAFAAAQPDLVLDFPAAKQDRRTLPDGSEFFSASGTITNTGRETRKVPSILIVMRNEREAVVYSWVLVPPKTRLAPGESVSINEIATDVPKSAKFAEIGWKPS